MPTSDKLSHLLEKGSALLNPRVVNASVLNPDRGCRQEATSQGNAFQETSLTKLTPRRADAKPYQDMAILRQLRPRAPHVVRCTGSLDLAEYARGHSQDWLRGQKQIPKHTTVRIMAAVSTIFKCCNPGAAAKNVIKNNVPCRCFEMAGR